MPIVKAITFDCWRTLLEATDNKEIENYRLENLLKTLHRMGYVQVSETQLQEVIIKRRREVASVQKELGKDIPPIQQINNILMDLNITISSREDSFFIELIKYYSYAPLHFHVPAITFAAELINRLSKTYKIALICNTGVTPGKIVRILLERANIPVDKFDYMFFSDEHGISKPNKEVFNIIAHKLNVSEENILHVGDDFDTDVTGAMNAGMHAVWLSQQKPNTNSNIFTINNLHSLMSIVEKINRRGVNI